MEEEEDKKTPFFQRDAWKVPGIEDVGIGGYIGGATGLLSMLGNTMLADYEKDLNYNPSANQYIDVKALESQEFERSPFKLGNIAKGAAAGVAVGGGVGAIAGGAIGLGTAIWDWAKQNKAKNEFEQEKEEKITDATQRNYAFGDEQKERRVGAQSVNSQIKNFYKNIPF